MIDSKWTRQWPELFNELSDDQARAIVSAVDNSVLEGWKPAREDLELMTRSAREDLSWEEFAAQAVAAGKRVNIG